MNIRKTSVSLLVLGFSSIIASADQPLNANIWFEPGVARYEEKEWSIDGTAVISSRSRENFSDSNTIGVGIGMNYFITRYFGVGADTYIDSFDYPNHIDLNALARLPIMETPWAPYAIGGFGRQFHDLGQWTGHIGAGVEYRWNRVAGLFFDVREVFAATSPDFSVWRVGMRVRF
jgi:hypothetical protein